MYLSPAQIFLRIPQNWKSNHLLGISTWIFHRHPNLNIPQNSINHLSHPISHLSLFSKYWIRIPILEKLDTNFSLNIQLLKSFPFYLLHIFQNPFSIFQPNKSSADLPLTTFIQIQNTTYVFHELIITYLSCLYIVLYSVIEPWETVCSLYMH